jgi:hypothetical protein
VVQSDNATEPYTDPLSARASAPRAAVERRKGESPRLVLERRAEAEARRVRPRRSGAAVPPLRGLAAGRCARRRLGADINANLTSPCIYH